MPLSVFQIVLCPSNPPIQPSPIPLKAVSSPGNRNNLDLGGDLGKICEIN